MESNLLTLIYVAASVSFILGLKMLSNPVTARRGNAVAASGMCAAILGTIFLYRDDQGNHLRNYGWIVGGILIGSVIGTLAAKRVKMTAMPEMVSMFNGMGGACAALISVSEFLRISKYYHTKSIGFSNVLAAHDYFSTELIIIFAGLIIGSISFAGSMIAWGKLSGKFKDITFPGQHIVNALVLLVIIALSVFLVSSELRRFTFIDIATPLFFVVLLLSLTYGVLFVMPIGGADMPVVISLLNSFTGVAAACGGFLYDNKVMLTGGILVGAAGTLLTILMCKAMNRSLINVLVGSFGASNTAGGPATRAAVAYKEISIADAAVVLSYANKAIIIPGYGLAVAQAQHTCHELERLLESRGVEVLYAIHPVAGRMPGHMNVLLAEADVNYEKLLEMDDANAQFPTTDVVLVLGANDVVNPAAKNDPSSPIYGMPILEAELARSVIVNKRSMKPGYAGIENELFYGRKTSMLFGDAKKVLQDLVAEIKAH